MSGQYHPHRQTTTSPPPWEIRPVQQVPYVEASVANASRKSTRAGSAPAISKTDSSYGRERPAAITTPAYEQESSQRRWHPPATHNTPPYDTSFERQISSPLPNLYNGHHVPQAPPTPPDSVKLGDHRFPSSTAGQSQHQKAFSGTMSSRDGADRSHSSHRARSEGRAPRLRTTGQEEPPTGIGKKFKSAMKDLFHRSPVDASDCEPVRTRHWTEDDY